MQRHPREGWKAARQVMEARTGRPVTRRDFLKTSAGAGIALPSLAAIMAACTNPRDTSPDNPSNSAGQLGAARPDNPLTLPLVGEPIADGLPSEKGATLQIFNWDAYMWKKIIEEFCAEEGCDYEWTTFNNMEEAVTKIQSGQFKFDVFFPTYDVLGKMVLASSSARSTRATSRTSPTYGTRCRARSTTWVPSTRCRTSCTRPASPTAATRSPTT